MNKTQLLLGIIAIFGVTLYLSTSDSQTTMNDTTFGWQEFNNFRREYGKLYQNEKDVMHRLAVFQKNLRMIREHNADVTKTYTLGVNQFSDLLFEEFSAYYLGKADTKPLEFIPTPPLYVSNQNEVVDWRDKGIVGPIKNQQRCGSCWAFSAIAQVEQVYALFKNTKGLLLSEQELVDCSKSYGNHGCSGGWEDKALLYVKDHGVNKEEAYPYRAVDQQCKNISKPGVNKIEGREFVDIGPEAYLQTLRKQPTTSSFHVKSDFFQYKSGVYNTSDCPIQANHAVNAVGFGLSEDEKQSYFLVRNSWGESWGEKGYFKISIAEGDGVCGFSTKEATTYAFF